MKLLIKTTVLLISAALLSVVIFGQSGYIGSIEVIEDTDGLIKFNIYDVEVGGMLKKQVHFGMWISQEGEWLEDTWVEIEPQYIEYDPVAWSHFWFHYPYQLLMQAGDPDGAYWGSFFIIDTAANTVISRKDAEFSLGVEDNSEDYELVPHEGSIVTSFDWYYEGKRWRESFAITDADYNLSVAERDNFQPVYGRSDYRDGYIMLWDIDIAEFYTDLYGYLYYKNRHRLDDIKQKFLEMQNKYNLDYRQLAEFIISWVQHTTYELPEKMYGIYTQLELVESKTGDCDTRSVILYTIFRDLGYEVIIFYSEYYQHAMLGIANVGSGDYIKHNGTKYYFVETTASGWDIGTLPPEWSNTRYWQVIVPKDR